jgi:alkanesulfonate monooxygenase SsuD/methylene tetrahydromethanopterin reductase-like flavin-dependent oxidoreductase (luciferase family)
MKEIWTKDEAEFHGKYVDFDPIWSWPKPAQKPHPPILVGGDGPRTLERVIEYGDEWMPIAMRGIADLSAKIARLQEMAAKAGRGRIPVSTFGTPPRREAVEEFAGIGVDRCVFGVPPAPADVVIPALKRRAEAAGLMR